jgi:hypothetical protein
MKRRYHCPHCGRLLNPGQLVVFVVESSTQKELVLLSPEPGDYAMVYPETLELEPGTAYVFRCPVCQADLRSELNENLVEITAQSEDGSSVRVNFSRVYGEHATFVLHDMAVERYGPDAERYEVLNFFGAGEFDR